MVVVPPRSPWPREQLIAARACARRLAISGLDALAASERRVVEIGTEGLTNPEIAQALFVTAAR